MTKKNLKFLSVHALLIFLAACAVQKRTPSGAVPDLNVKSCGLISSNETSRTALDAIDVLYTLQIDCNKDGKIGQEDAHILAAFEYNEIRPQQKSWLRNLHKKVVLAEKKASALPYVCVKYKAEADPCLTFKNIYGIEPAFSDQKQSNQGQNNAN